MSYHRCDCGQAADKRDGSGWSCAECRRVVSAAQAMLDEYITKKRAAENEHSVMDNQRARQRRWVDKNREKIRLHWREWSKRQKGPKADVAFNHFAPSCNVRPIKMVSSLSTVV